jgi:tyrosyl-tRNA synthetase
MPTMNILDELEARGQVADSTDRAALRELLGGAGVPFYCGFDPTGVSLHLGSLVPITLMARLQRAGHRPIAVVGGATGMIGDPSGKSDERNLLDRATLARNLAGIKAQLSRFLDFDDGPSGALLLNNADWTEGVSYLDFLREFGKHLTINYMMAKEAVRARLEDRDQGISYTEFSYMLLQAFDFVQLAEQHDCRLQIGATDQWGNITAGIELQRKLGRPGLHGLVCPLLLDSTGKKMGKTAAGTSVWLDPALTSPYALYQYLLNVEDTDVERLLLTFSWRPLEEIAEIAGQHAGSPGRRLGQKALATDVVRFVHGQEALDRAERASQVMFGGSLADLHDADLEPLLADVPSSEIPRTELEQGMSLVDLLARTGLCDSKGAARRLVTSGGVYINNERVNDPALTVSLAHLATETMLVLRAGKKSYHILRCAR